MGKPAIKLNKDEFMKAAIANDLETNAQIADALGVAATQVWRALLPESDPRRCFPGVSFIAGTLKAFGGPFEKFFFLE